MYRIASVIRKYYAILYEVLEHSRIFGIRGVLERLPRKDSKKIILLKETLLRAAFKFWCERGN